MRIRSFLVAVLTALMISTAASAGISDNSRIKAQDALLIGGEQPGWIDIDGQNRGKTELTLIVQNGEKSKVVGRVAPGKSFNQSVPKYQTLMIKNKSGNNTAKVYWHISRYSKYANPRRSSHEESAPDL